MNVLPEAFSHNQSLPRDTLNGADLFHDEVSVSKRLIELHGRWYKWILFIMPIGFSFSQFDAESLSAIIREISCYPRSRFAESIEISCRVKNPCSVDAIVQGKISAAFV